VSEKATTTEWAVNTTDWTVVTTEWTVNSTEWTVNTTEWTTKTTEWTVNNNQNDTNVEMNAGNPEKVNSEFYWLGWKTMSWDLSTWESMTANSKELPKTWPESILIIFASLILWSIIYLRNRKTA
jgi:hypothetical protein